METTLEQVGTAKAVDNREVEILQKKLETAITNSRGRVNGIIERIEKEGSMLSDFVAPMGNADKAFLTDKRALAFHSNGVVSLMLLAQEEKLTLHPHAITQAGEKLGIPTAYIRNLAHGKGQWQRDLAAEILNRHSLNTDRQRVLVRTVGNQVRGILSDSYRRLSTPEIYRAFFEEIKAQGGIIIDAYADDTRSGIDVVIPQVFTIPTENNGNITVVFGCRIANSDFGDGALTLSSYVIQVVCFNGMTRENLLRQVHLGKRLPDDLSISENTYRLDTQTQASAVRDITRTALGKDRFQKEVNAIQQATGTVIDIDNEIKRLPVIGFTKGEAEGIKKVLINSNPADGVAGAPTMWKLTQAITAFAQDEAVLERRKREMQEMAGKMGYTAAK